MPEWITPVIDRTYVDIKNAKETIRQKKTDSSAQFPESKGCINYTDLNRIENNISFLASKLGLSISPHKIWDVFSLPFNSDRTIILSNANSVREKFLSRFPEIKIEEVPEALSYYENFNQLEKMQLQIYEYLLNVPEYDRDKIAVVELDENLIPTGNVTYFGTTSSAGTYIYNHQENNYAVYIGEDAGITFIESSAFSGCGNLKSISVPDTITEIGSSAFHSSGIKDFQLHAQSVTIGRTAFAGSALETVSLSGVIPASIYMFYECTSLRHVDYDGSSITDYMFEGCTSLQSITLGNHVASIGYRSFLKCALLKSVVFPDSVTTIEDYTFMGCSSLQTISIGNGIQSISTYAFRDCGVETIIINLPEDGVPGKKWGANSADVIWTG